MQFNFLYLSKLKDRVWTMQFNSWFVLRGMWNELTHMIYRGSEIVPTSTLISLFKVFSILYKVCLFLGIVSPEMFGVPRVRQAPSIHVF